MLINYTKDSDTRIAILIVLVFIISYRRNSYAFALCCEDIAQWHAILNPVILPSEHVEGEEPTTAMDAATWG
jgi:hypothetical protein